MTSSHVQSDGGDPGPGACVVGHQGGPDLKRGVNVRDACGCAAIAGKRVLTVPGQVQQAAVKGQAVGVTVAQAHHVGCVWGAETRWAKQGGNGQGGGIGRNMERYTNMEKDI